MTIKSRLLSFGFLSIAFAVLVGVIGFWAADFLGRQMGRNLVAMSALRNSMEADMMHDALRADVFAAVIAADHGNSAGLAAARSDMKEHGDQFRAALVANQALELDASAKDALQKLMPQVEGYIDAANDAGATAAKGASAIQAKLPAFLKTFGELEDEMAGMSKKIEAFAQSNENSAKGAVDFSKYGIAACAALAAIVLILFSLRLTRGICRPLDRAVVVARGIAGGDLSHAIEVRGNDETAQLLEAMSNMQGALSRVIDQTRGVVDAAGRGDLAKRIDSSGMAGFQVEITSSVNTLISTCEAGINEVVRVLGALAKGDLTQKIDAQFQGTFERLKSDANATVAQLTEVVERLKDSADTINVASKEIASGNADLSQRTEEQASSLEETASSMEELTSTVKQNAENAKQANQLAIGASEIATRGGKVVGEVVSTMEGITESSRKIADIIGVIDGIAFQTNILALNAAVEAARAGEQGRGFAVVATEVRNLAQRSAAAAKEIKTLIGDSVGKVEAGSRQVDEAGKTMAEILSSVKRVTDIMAEISAASLEQSSGIEQVSTAVAQMDEVTQQNAALVEEAAAAAESLEEQAGTLAQTVTYFKVASVIEAATERRQGPRPKNVRRLPDAGKAADAKAATPARKVAAAGTAQDDWQEF